MAVVPGKSGPIHSIEQPVSIYIGGRLHHVGPLRSIDCDLPGALCPHEIGRVVAGRALYTNGPCPMDPEYCAGKMKYAAVLRLPTSPVSV